MKLLRHILDFYLNSSIHVGLAVTAMTLITQREMGLPADPSTLFFNFFATVTAYNFVKYFGLAKFHHRSLADWLRIIQIFSAFCFLGLAYFSLKIQFNVLLFYLVFGIITFLYAVPFVPKRILFDSQRNLRSISGIKIYVIATVWVAATVIAPIINADASIDINALVKSIQVFFIVIVWTLPFEIRDLNYDSIKLSTIPQQIGIRTTKILGLTLVVIIVCLELYRESVVPYQASITSAICAFSSLLLLLAKKNQGKYYSSFLVEAIPIIWMLLILAF